MPSLSPTRLLHGGWGGGFSFQLGFLLDRRAEPILLPANGTPYCPLLHLSEGTGITPSLLQEFSWEQNERQIRDAWKIEVVALVESVLLCPGLAQSFDICDFSLHSFPEWPFPGSKGLIPNCHTYTATISRHWSLNSAFPCGWESEASDPTLGAWVPTTYTESVTNDEVV